MPTPLLPPQGAPPRDIAKAVNAALLGKINSVGEVTLAPGASSTVVENVLVSASSKLFLFPQTANAAAEMGLGVVYIQPGNVINGVSFSINHASSSDTDRTFFYAILG